MMDDTITPRVETRAPPPAPQSKTFIPDQTSYRSHEPQSNTFQNADYVPRQTSYRSHAPAPARYNEYFIPRDGIDREVITADICRYLGNDALVRPGSYTDPSTGVLRQGYFINAYRNLTTAMIADLKADSQKWNAERREARGRALSRDYRDSVIHQSRQYYGPTEASHAPGYPDSSSTYLNASSIYGNSTSYKSSNSSIYPPQPQSSPQSSSWSPQTNTGREDEVVERDKESTVREVEGSVLQEALLGKIEIEKREDEILSGGQQLETKTAHAGPALTVPSSIDLEPTFGPTDSEMGKENIAVDTNPMLPLHDNLLGDDNSASTHKKIDPKFVENSGSRADLETSYNYDSNPMDSDESDESCGSELSVDFNFSLAGAVSTAASELGDPATTNRAEVVLSKIFTEDKILAPLIRTALEKFQRNRVINNLRSFICGFSVLHNSPGESNEKRMVLKFLTGRARIVATRVCEIIQPANALFSQFKEEDKKTNQLEHEGEDYDFSDTDSISHDDAPAFDEVHLFLTQGEPLQLLRDAFGRFVAGESISDWNKRVKQQSLSIRKPPTELEGPNQSEKIADPLSGLHPDAKGVDLDERISPPPKSQPAPEVAVTENATSNFHATDWPSDSIVALPNGDGFQVKWKCRCGRRFGSRITATDRRAAERFFMRMQWNVKRDGPTITHCFGYTWLERLVWALAPGFLARFSFENSPSGNESVADLELGVLRSRPQVVSPPAEPEHHDVATENPPNAVPPVTDEETEVFVCLCLPKNRLRHAKMPRAQSSDADSVTIVNNGISARQGMDRVLFDVLQKKVYTQRSMSFRAVFRASGLIKPTGLQFCQFKLYYTGKAKTVKKFVSLIDKTELRLPHEEPQNDQPTTVSNTQNKEWQYSSLKGEIFDDYKEQLLNSDYVFHLLQHPECASPDSPIWNVLPRKIKRKLVNPYSKPKTGWGFSVEESWNSERFTVLMCPLIILGFGIATWLSIRYKLPIAAGFTIAMAPVAVVSWLTMLAPAIGKERGLVK